MNNSADNIAEGEEGMDLGADGICNAAKSLSLDAHRKDYDKIISGLQETGRIMDTEIQKMKLILQKKQTKEVY